MSISQPLPDRGVISGSCPAPRFPRHLPTTRCPPRPHMTHGSGHRGLGPSRCRSLAAGHRPLAQQKGQARRKRDLPLSRDPGEKRPRATGPCRFESRAGGVACTSPLPLEPDTAPADYAPDRRARAMAQKQGFGGLVNYSPEIAHPVLVAKGRSHHGPHAAALCRRGPLDPFGLDAPPGAGLCR